MASEEKCAFLKSVLVNADSSEQELTHAYLQLAFQFTSNKSSKNDERSHAARLRDITSLFLKRVPAEKYKGQSDDEILLCVFKDAVSFTFKDNSQSRVLESSSSQSYESTPDLNGSPTTQVQQDSKPNSQGTPNIFDILKESPSTVANKQECIQDQVVGQTQSQVKTQSVLNSEEAQHSVSGQSENRDQVKVDNTRSSSSSVGGIGQTSLKTVSYTHTINETACEQQKAKDIDQAKVGAERKDNREQYHCHQERGGSQVESTNQLSDSIANYNSSAINMSQWSESQKGAWPNGPGVTSSGWTPMDPSHGQNSAKSQDNGKGNSSSGTGVMSSIWGSSSAGGSTPTSSGWGGIPASTSSSSPFHPGLFQNPTSNGHSGGSSVWGTPTTPQPGGKGALPPFGGSNPVSAPSTTSASNPSTSQSSGWDTSANQNGIEPQPASTPTSAESTPAVPTSQTSSSGASSNGNGNAANGNEGGSASNGQEPQQQITPSSTVNTSNAPGSSWGSSNPPGPATLTGTSAWGTPPAQSSGGWGSSDPSGQASGQENKPWGGASNMPANSSRGWGGSSAAPNEVTGTGGWGKPPASDGTSGWGARQPPTPTNGPPAGWNKDGNKDGNQQAAPGWNNRPSGWGNQPPQPAGGMKKDQPDSGQSGWGKPSGSASWAQTASKGTDSHRGMNPGEPTPVDQASIAALVKTPWGKRPVNQEMKWDSKAPQQASANQAGTQGWGAQPAQDRQWEKAEQPKQSAWGKPNPPQTPAESSWGTQPPTSGPSSNPQTLGWGPPKERTDSQDSGWGQPPTTTSAPSGMPGGSHGPPAPGFNTERSSPPQKDAMETGSNASSNTPQPPAEDPSQMLPGPPPKKIVATGWGDVSMVDRTSMQTVDNGTSHWGDPNDHNRRLTRRQAGGHMPQMGGNPQTSTMQGPPPTGPQGDTSMPPSSMMPSAASSQFKADNQWDDKSKPTSWGDFPNQRSNNNNSSSMWNQPGGTKWDQSSTSSWGPSSSTSVSTQNKDSMQQNWHDDNSTGSIGHWGDEEWENRSQSSESSMSGWRGGPKKPRPTGQRESNHYISKLKRLMDYGFPKEVAEVALRKHNFHFETALAELRQISDMMDQNKIQTGDVDDSVRQMTRTMSNMGIGDNPLTSGSDLTNANMLLNNSLPGTLPLGGKPSNMMGTPGFMPTGSVGQRFTNQQQNLVMGQQPGGLNQPPRGPFNQQQQMMQQQQHQQLFQVLLQLAVQSGIVNQSLLQQQVTPTQIMSIVQRYPQLLAQAQAQQGNLPPVGGANSVGKSMNSAPNRSQQELMARFVQQQLLQGQRPPVSRQPFPARPKVRSDSEMYSNTSTPSDLLGNIGNMNPDIGMREPPQQSRLQHLFGKPGTKNFPRTNRSESVTGLPENSRRGSNWSRSNSPTPSDSMPNSADSAFSDSGWNFPQPDNISSMPDDVPEFIPGVPWNPQPSLDVSNDPSATPGMYAPSKMSGRDSQQKDDISGILTRPMKPQTSWSSSQPGGGRKTSWNYEGSSSSQSVGGSRSNQLWNSAPGNHQRATRPPPGLGSSWSSGNGMSGATSLLISGVTSDMNVTALRTICGQQGQVDQFQENRAQGSVMVTYRFPEDAAKAHTTISSTFPAIIAELVSPTDAFSTPASSSSGWPQGGSSSGSKFGNGVLPSTSSASGAGKDDSSSKQSWSTGLPAMPGSQLWSPGPGGSMGWSPMDGDTSSASNFSFLPGDLLGESTN